MKPWQFSLRRLLVTSVATTAMASLLFVMAPEVLNLILLFLTFISPVILGWFGHRFGSDQNGRDVGGLIGFMAGFVVSFVCYVLHVFIVLRGEIGPSVQGAFRSRCTHSTSLELANPALAWHTTEEGWRNSRPLK